MAKRTADPRSVLPPSANVAANTPMNSHQTQHTYPPTAYKVPRKKRFFRGRLGTKILHETLPYITPFLLIVYAMLGYNEYQRRNAEIITIVYE
jgi:hypothetical protein